MAKAVLVAGATSGVGAATARRVVESGWHMWWRPGVPTERLQSPRIPGDNVCGATSAFVRQFSPDLRSSLHGTSRRVTSIESGMVKTDFALVRTCGDRAASGTLYVGFELLTADDVAETLYWFASLPAHVKLDRMELMLVSQSWAGFQVYRTRTVRRRRIS